MPSHAVIHPDHVFEQILISAAHPTKKRNLQLIHQNCRELQNLGVTDFSLRKIGELIESKGGIKAKALWNAQSADYRKLIEAWQAYVGPTSPKRHLASHSSLALNLSQNISDPATRIIVEQIVRERNSLRAEVNILKSNTRITIDRRPAGSLSTVRTGVDIGGTGELTVEPRLNLLEREALTHAISSELWSQEGWLEEKHGRVVMPISGTMHTRTIFKPGYVTAIKKLLSSF